MIRPESWTSLPLRYGRRRRSGPIEDRDMNYHAADQLTRQRRDQLVREASGDQLMAMARNADPTARRGTQDRGTHIGRALHVSATSLLLAVSGLLGQLPDVRRPGLDRRAIEQRRP